MAGQVLRYGRSWVRVAVAASVILVTQSVASAPPLEQVAAGVKIDASLISVSGISSGGFMAHQFHVAHSEHVMGAGIVAGGPYWCARGNILDAVTRCSQFLLRECAALGFDAVWCRSTDLAPKSNTQVERVARASFDEAKKQEASGRIDKLGNLRDDRVYLISAEYDKVVPHGVMDAVFRFYADPDKAGVPAENIVYNRTFPARHTMVRDSYNKPGGGVAVGNCPLPRNPGPESGKDSFIDDCEAVAQHHQRRNGCICPSPTGSRAVRDTTCPPSNKQQTCKDLKDVDLAGAIFSRIYGELSPQSRAAVAESEVQAFDQGHVFSKLSDRPHYALQNASMARVGYVFIPQTCKDGRACKLHVAFHGCLQGDDTDRRAGHSGNLFSKYAGYNGWAKANDIVVLYPQVQARNLPPPLAAPFNPQGCWDWWGQNYTHEAYHTNHGKQIKAVAQMINILVGKSLLNVPAE